MAVLSTYSRYGRPPTLNDPLPIFQHDLAGFEDAHLIEPFAPQLKANKFIGLPQVMPHDFNLTDGSHGVMYVTFRMGPRRELVFRIGPETIMRHAIDCCLRSWVHPEGREFMAWELLFYLPCNTRIDYYKPLTAMEVSLFRSCSLWWAGR
jgi:hypothetical protein